MKLYYNVLSPNCRRVLATIYHLNLPVELQSVDFESGTLEEGSFLKKNPNGFLPTFEDGSFCIWEGNAIMQYLADKKAGNTLYPQDAKGRADIARWQFWQVAHFGPACSTLTFENLLKKMFGMGAPDPKAVEEGLAEFRQFAKTADTHLSTHKYFCGETLTLADFSIAASLTYAAQANIPLGEFTHLKKWYSTIETLDAWKKSAPKF